MSVLVCDRCGDIAVEPDVCRCRTPYDPVAVRRRHRQAVIRARATAALLTPERRRPSRAA